MDNARIVSARRDAGPRWARCSRRHTRNECRMTAVPLLLSVIDDDDSVRESLPDLLRELGFAAAAYDSAEAFLASDLIGRTRCLVLDVAMPGMTGPELQEELARREQSIPI